MTKKTIVHAGVPFILAGRAVEWLKERPDVKDVILSFDNVDIYVKRNKSGFTVSLCQ